MDNLLREILQESQDKKKIIGIRIYGHEDSFYSGYVQSFNDEIFQIRHFSTYGKDDGIVIEKIEGIENIEYNEDYSESQQYIVQKSDEIDKSNLINYNFDLSENWKSENLKKFIGQKILVNIENSKMENICGFIIRVTESELIMNTIGELGKDEGLSYYKLEDISSIQPDDLECRKRLCLYNWKTNKK
jgi:hypothetical protein